jgi:tetratricopeptide (TPR) repeat protein
VPGGISFALALHSAHRDLAGILMDQNRTPEAIEEMIASIPFDPNDSRLFQMLGGAYSSMGRHDRAIQSFRTGLGIAPDSFTMRFDLATAMHESGDDASALRELLEAGKRTPDLDSLDLADWHFGMGTVLIGMPEKEQEAFVHLREGLSLNPDHPNALEVRRVLSSSQQR